jgi:hypothetical protein
MAVVERLWRKVTPVDDPPTALEVPTLDVNTIRLDPLVAAMRKARREQARLEAAAVHAREAAEFAREEAELAQKELEEALIALEILEREPPPAEDAQ